MFPEFNNLITKTEIKEIQGFEIYPEALDEWNIIIRLSISDENKTNKYPHLISMKIEFSIDAKHMELFMQTIGGIIKNNIKEVNKEFCSIGIEKDDMFIVIKDNVKIPLYMNNIFISMFMIPKKNEEFMPCFKLAFEDNRVPMIYFNLDNYNSVDIRCPENINFESLKEIYDTYRK